MSSKNLEYSKLSQRVLDVAEYFKKHKGINNKDLLNRAGIGHSFFSNIRNNKINNPNSEMLRKIVLATGINGHWLLTGEGQMFEARANAGEGPGGAFSRALAAIQRIEQQPGGAADIPLPAGLELELARLLVKLLEHRGDSAGTAQESNKAG